MKKAAYAVALALLLTCAFLAGRHHSRPVQASDKAGARKVLYYVDPMHPAYKSEKPGIAPDCGMDLEPVYADEEGQTAAVGSSVPMPAGTVSLDLEKQQLIGLRLASVERSEGTHKVRLLGRVSVEDTRVYRVTAAVQGWVQGTYGDSAGTAVKKEQRLAAFYSPEFVTFENGYLAATERGTTPMKEFMRGVQYSGDRLRALGMSEAQIKEIADTRKMPSSIDVVSPTDGFILARNISPGMRFERQTEFYQIADLSHVWIIAEIFENEAQYFRPGVVAHVSLPGQRKTFPARISNVLPQVDPATRTLKLRLEAGNPGFALRPDMFVDVELPVSMPSGLTVPMDAVIDFGVKKRVFVDRGNGFFEPREIESGWQYGDRVQIVKGLSADERVVTGGTFLLDSESRLRAPATGTTGALGRAENHGDSMQPASPQSKPTTKVNVMQAGSSGKKPDPYLAADRNRTSHDGAGHD